MSSVSARYATTAEGFTRRVDAVGADQWAAATPCSEWTVRDLLAHVIDVHRRMLAKVGSEPAPAASGDDLPVQWGKVRSAVGEALGDETRATAVVAGPVGQQPFESLVDGLVCADTLIHTWDLARAIGQDERLDPNAVETAMEFLRSLGDGMRTGGETFGAEIRSEPGADAQTRLLNFCGRALPVVRLT